MNIYSFNKKLILKSYSFIGLKWVIFFKGAFFKGAYYHRFHIQQVWLIP
jgi:hypothetical protein